MARSFFQLVGSGAIYPSDGLPSGYTAKSLPGPFPIPYLYGPDGHIAGSPYEGAVWQAGNSYTATVPANTAFVGPFSPTNIPPKMALPDGTPVVCVQGAPPNDNGGFWSEVGKIASGIPGAILDAGNAAVSATAVVTGLTVQAVGSVTGSKALNQAGKDIVTTTEDVNQVTVKDPIHSGEVIVGTGAIVVGAYTGNAAAIAAGIGLAAKGTAGLVIDTVQLEASQKAAKAGKAGSSSSSGTTPGAALAQAASAAATKGAVGEANYVPTPGLGASSASGANATAALPAALQPSHWERFVAWLRGAL